MLSCLAELAVAVAGLFFPRRLKPEYHEILCCRPKQIEYKAQKQQSDMVISMDGLALTHFSYFRWFFSAFSLFCYRWLLMNLLNIRLSPSIYAYK